MEEIGYLSGDASRTEIAFSIVFLVSMAVLVITLLDDKQRKWLQVRVAAFIPSLLVGGFTGAITENILVRHNVDETNAWYVGFAIFAAVGGLIYRVAKRESDTFA